MGRSSTTGPNEPLGSTADLEAADRDTADREISATRTFDAPRERVYDLFTAPEHINAWWGPHGFTSEVQTMDVRPGGAWTLTVTGPDGTVYPNHCTYTAVDRPSLLAYRHDSPPPFETTIRFTELSADRTQVHMRMEFANAALRDAVATKHGAVEGLSQTLERLRERLDQQQQAALGRTLVVTREFDHPAEAVFDAWFDANTLGHWLFAMPDGNVTKVEVDARVGGTFVVVDRRAGQDVEHHGRYEQIDRPRKIVFQFGDAQMTQPTRVTVEIEPLGPQRCRLSLTHELDPAWVPHRRSARGGWTAILEALAAELAHDDATVVLHRTYDAPLELVWAAWTQPQRLAAWFGPKGVPVTASRMEFHPGGTYLYTLQPPNGRPMHGRWDYLQIIPLTQLVWLHAFADAQGNIVPAPFPGDWPRQWKTTLSFVEHGGKTTLLLRWSLTEASAEQRAFFKSMHDNMRAGWDGTFAQLGAYLAAHTAPTTGPAAAPT